MVIFAKTVGNYGEQYDYVNMNFIGQSHRRNSRGCYEFLLKFLHVFFPQQCRMTNLEK